MIDRVIDAKCKSLLLFDAQNADLPLSLRRPKKPKPQQQLMFKPEDDVVHQLNIRPHCSNVSRSKRSNHGQLVALARRGLKSRILHHTTDQGSVNDKLFFFSLSLVFYYFPCQTLTQSLSDYLFDSYLSITIIYLCVVSERRADGDSSRDLLLFYKLI